MTTTNDLSSLLTPFLKQYGIGAAISVAVFHDGHIETFTSPSSKDRRPVTPHTRFQAASISKPVTTMAVLKLVDQGVLDLDVDVRTYLEKGQAAWTLVFDKSLDPTTHVTLRHLLTHTAGTTVHGFGGYGIGAPHLSTAEVLASKTDPVVVDQLPGTAFRYSGGGTTIVQLVLETVLALPFATILHNVLLGPLGLTDSSFEIDETKGDHLAFAQPSDTGEWLQTWQDWWAGYGSEYHIYPQLAAAGLWTTPTDLAKLKMAVMASIRGDASAFWSRASIDQLLKPTMMLPLPGGGSAAIGLGWFLTNDDDGDLSALGHSGANMGFRSQCTTFTKRNGGYVVMANSECKGGWMNRTPSEKLHSELLALLKDRVPKPSLE
ncbi:Aste57867_15303 [Aphanomyces stellatus]|uniref:Aste57867_15303 protein n=1 Tax=Aphanomyces stellatus TaxID=120398 RepID=A0A485L454_9STRA|nr:hypothetical protein As57867_015247 [Aphanomyces stellatus]VFT92112.1 Aste57867_15303 [Aphanomyces stellatus]